MPEWARWLDRMRDNKERGAALGCGAAGATADSA